MGLDLVNIIITIEEEFGIEIPEDGFSPIVGDLQELVVNAYEASIFDEVMSLLPDNDDTGNMPYDPYFALWQAHPWLPKPKGLFRRKTYHREIVESHLLRKKEYAGNPDLIRKKVAEIIKDELCMKVNPKPQDHLINDLGAD